MYAHLFAKLDSGATLVAANNRLTRTLREAYNQAQTTQQRPAWPAPAVRSWHEWLQRLWQESRLLGGTGTQLSLLSETECAVLWEQLVTADIGIDSDTANLARLAMQAWQMVCDCDGLGAPEWVESGLTQDQQQFLQWSGQFRDRCTEQQWIDPQRLPTLLLADIEAGLFDDLGPLVFSGFDEWSVVQTRLLRALESRDIQVEIDTPPAVKATNIRVACESERAELEQAALWARMHLEADRSQAVCIVVPDLAARAGEVRRAVMDIFDPAWRTQTNSVVPVNLSFGEALANRPRVAAALNCLRLLQGIQPYTTCSLALRTPFLRDGRSEAGARAVLDLRLRDRLGAAFYVTEARADAERFAPGFAAILDTFSHATANLQERSLAAWASWLTDLLQAVGWPGDDKLDSVAFQELEAWHRLLRDFAGSSRVRGPVDWQTAFSLLDKLAWNRLHQPQHAGGGLEIMGVLEASGHGFDQLWVVGMAEDRWPAVSQPQAFLPFGLQRRLALPGSTPQLELEQARRATARLAGSATEVVFSWPCQKDGESLGHSRLIDAVEIAPTSDEHIPLWNRLALDTADTEIVTPDLPARWPTGQVTRGGAYLFRLQAVCPLRAFIEFRLGAGEIDEPATGLSYKQRGNFTHQILEDFFRQYDNSVALNALTQQQITAEFEKICAHRARTLPGLSRAFMRAIVDLEILRLLPLLTAYVLLEQDRSAFRVVGAESGEEVAVGPIRVRLKLDRIDALDSGALLVIDYKTGKVARSNWNPAKPGDMQLPLYATFTKNAVDGVAFAQLSAHGVKLEGIADATILIEGIDSPQQTRVRLRSSEGEKIADWPTLKAEWQECLLALAERFAAGDCSMNPKYAEPAQGQLAVLTRVYDLDDSGDSQEVYGDITDG